MPPRDNVALGLLVVHGIGSQARGDTLRAFTEPFAEFLASRLTTSTDVIGRLRQLRDVRPAAGRHSVELEFAGLGANHRPCKQRWLVAECYWDDVVRADDLGSLWAWLVNVVPWLLMWQLRASVTAGLAARLGSGGRWLNPLSWYGFLCNFFWSLTIRSLLCVLFFAAMIPGGIILVLARLSGFAQPPRVADALVRASLATFGDAEAFVTRPELAKAMEKRFHAEYNWLAERSNSIVIVAHSQGAALSYRALRALDEAELASLKGVFCVGSGLGPLSSARAPSRSFALSIATLIFALPGFVTLPLALIPIVVTATLVVWALIFPLVILFLLVWGLVFFPADVVSGIGELMSALATRVGADILSMMPLLAIALPLAAPSLVVTLFVGGGRRRKLRPPVPVDRWIEYYSPLDPVSLGTRSGNHATVVRVVNLCGRNIFTEHSSYFANDVHVLPDLCERLGSWMSLRLPGNRDAAPFSLRRRITTRLVLAAPSIVTLLAFIAGRPLHIW